jgi:hypothetical protein
MLALLAALSLFPTDFLTLYRGSTIGGSDTRYWSCEDITIDREHALRSNGQGLLLSVGPGKRALLRFGDLQRAVGPGKRVTSAKLVLEPVGFMKPGQVKLYRFNARWNEGAGMGEPTQQPPEGATTWAFQWFRSKGAPWAWKDGGAAFMAGEASAVADVTPGSKEITFEGLANDLQGFVDRWYENNGWAIECSVDGSFNSAQGGEAGPRLLIETVDSNITDGPDLSVTCITRTPEYERYDNRGHAYARMSVGGHESGVMMNPGKADTKKWPSDGEEVTYTAFVKNVGNAPSTGATYTWSSDLKSVADGRLDSIAPGETKQVTFKTKFRNDHTDHRNQPISLHLKPNGSDACAANDFLEVQACALNIGIWVDEAFYKSFSEKVNGSGTHAFEDWIQWQVRIWNDVFMRHSRFSFAQDGCRESIRVGRITIVPNGTLKGGAHLPNDEPSLIYDGEWGFDSSFGNAAGYIAAVRNVADRALIHEMSHQIGLIDLYWMNVDPSMPDGSKGKVRLRTGDHVLTRGCFDPFGGLMGGGDTRNDTLVHSALPIAQEALDTPLYRSSIFQPTDLYSMTDIAGLSKSIGFRRGYFGDFMYAMPGSVIVRATTRDSSPIKDGKLRFFQMRNGEIADGAPDFELTLKDGIAALPNRPTGLDAPFTTLTGFTLRPNPFGRIDVVGTNGVFLVELERGNQTEWSWLKAWQIVDASARGNKNIYVHELRFNVSQRPLKDGDWALKKTALDKGNSSGSNLANLLDGKVDTLYEASGGIGDWVEIDIGRDRPIGEVKLIMNGDANSFWKQFDILQYGTGQTVSQARIFASERDWQSASSQRSDIDPLNPSVRSVAYRGGPQTVRFIRIVNRSGGMGKLAGIEIREVEPPKQPAP